MHARSAELLPGPASRARCRRGLAGGHRCQSLFGTVAADREDGRCGTRGFALADLACRRGRGRASGAHRPPSGAGRSCPWSRSGGTQRTAALQSAGVGACGQRRASGRSSRSRGVRAAAGGRMNAGQLERLGELLLKLRLFKSRERLEALLQDAAARELAYADFLEQVLGEEVVAKTSKNVAMRTRS